MTNPPLVPCDHRQHDHILAAQSPLHIRHVLRMFHREDRLVIAHQSHRKRPWRARRIAASSSSSSRPRQNGELDIFADPAEGPSSRGHQDHDEYEETLIHPLPVEMASSSIRRRRRKDKRESEGSADIVSEKAGTTNPKNQIEN